MGVGMLLLAAVLWGIIGLFARPLLDLNFSPLQLSAFRALVSGICALLYCLIRNHRMLHISLRDIWIFAGTGILSFTGMNLFYYQTQTLCSLSTAAVLLYTSPVFVMLLSVPLFKEKLTARKMISLCLAVAGCALVSGVGTGAISPMGLATGLLSGFAFALYSIFGRYGLRKYNTFTIITYTFLLSAFVTVPFLDIPSTVQTIQLHPISLFLFLGLGSIAGFLPFVFYTKGLEAVSAPKAAIIVTLEPVVASLVGVFVFHEEMTWLTMTGIIVVIAAVLMLRDRKVGAS